jgi:hypothetical protein
MGLQRDHDSTAAMRGECQTDETGAMAHSSSAHVPVAAHARSTTVSCAVSPADECSGAHRSVDDGGN